jgi:hypothetical protein
LRPPPLASTVARRPRPEVGPTVAGAVRPYPEVLDLPLRSLGVARLLLKKCLRCETLSGFAGVLEDDAKTERLAVAGVISSVSSLTRSLRKLFTNVAKRKRKK